MAKSYEKRIETLDMPTLNPVRRAVQAEQSSVLDKTLLWGWLNWETVIWTIIIVVAVATRVYDLGIRAMHHDESIHARWSFDMYKGRFAYPYDPTYHGPFLYYAVMTSFMLFGGDNEANARLAPALFGIGIIILCWFLRPLIGKFGAAFAGLLVLISPTILYYSRSLRHDIFATFGEFLLLIGLFRFFQEKPGNKFWWLGLAGLGLGIAYSSHELIFLTVATLGLWLIIAFVFELGVLPERVKARIPGFRPPPLIEEPIITDELDDPVNVWVENSSIDNDLDDPEFRRNEVSVPGETNPTEEPELAPSKPPRPWPLRLLVLTDKGYYGFGAAFLFVMTVATLVSLRFILIPRDIVKYPGNGLPKGFLFLIGPEVDKWLAYVINGFVVAVIFGIFVGWLVSLAYLTPDEKLRGSAVLRGVLRVARQPKAVMLFLALFALVYIPLFSNFFSNLGGLADGLYKGVEYWLSVQGTRRLDQPWFYYPMLMLLYEPLPFFMTLTALFALPIAWIRRINRKRQAANESGWQTIITPKGLFAGFCLFWAVVAMLAYSIAGEKAPWLNMQIALPAILSSAILFEGFARRVAWRKLVHLLQGPLFGTIFVLLLATVGVLIGMLIAAPAPDKVTITPGGTTLDNNNTRTFMLLESLIVLIVGLILAWAIFWFWRSARISGNIMRTTIILIVGGVLLGYGFKSAMVLNYYNNDIAVEPMIYVQTAPDIPLFVQRVGRLARDVRDTYRLNPPAPSATNAVLPDPGGTNGLPILVSNEAAWPLTWYFRNYSDVGYFAPNNDSTQTVDALPAKDGRGNPYAVIALMSWEDQPKLQAQLKGQYTRYQVRFRWYFPQDDSGYGALGKIPPDSKNPDKDRKSILNTDWQKLWDTFTTQPSANQMWRYIMYREVNQPLQSADMVYYIRNELEPDLSGTSSSSTTDTTNFDLTDSSQPGLKNGQYKTPRTVVFAPNGDILVLDSGNGRIQRFGADGKFISKFGKIGTGDGQFQTIQFDGGAGGLAVDEDGNIYVSDSWNYRIQKFDSTGKLLTKWGKGFDTKGDSNLAKDNPTGFYGPRGLAYDKTKGELYVADTGNRRIVVFDKSGNFLRQFGNQGGGPAQFDEPVSVVVSPDGKVYVTDSRNKRVQILDRNGNYQSEIKVPDWKDQPLSEPYVALDGQGNVFVSDSANGRVLKYGKDGALLQTLDTQDGKVLVNPIGLGVGPDGFLYIADAKQHAIVKFKLG